MQNTKNILKYLTLGGLFAIPFIAFIVPSGMFFPFISGKGFAFRILVEILFGLFVMLAFIDKEYRPKFSWLTKSFILFTFIILIADLLGQNPYKSLWSNYERMEGFVLLAHLLLYYLVVSSVINTKELWNKLFNTSIFASVLMSFYGLFQLAGKIGISQGGVRLDGTFGNATYLAIYLVLHIFLCLYMLVSESQKNWQKWTYGSIIVLETIMLYFTATRGAILGLIGGLLLAGILIVWKEKENKTLRKIAYWLAGGVVVVILGFILLRGTPLVKNSPVLSRFSNLGFSEFQTQGRYYVWPMAVKGIMDRPLLGWGQESFNFVFNKYYDPGLFGQEEWFDRTHDLVLDWLIAGGIIGFLAYVSMYVAFFYYIWRKKSVLNTAQKSIITGTNMYWSRTNP
ncbi:MAG: O-antigen ligase family protein [Candidatus Zambryskibacteria bacterium]|nr:O-antigen ligase family protein [Candidatus Zambryskibacteria bacterium]